MNSFELDSLKLSNFGSPKKDCGLVLDKKSKFDSYVDVCVETLVDFMNDYLCLDRDFIEKQKKKLTSSIFFLNGENNMADDNVVLFQIFEENLSNLLNANAICLANKIPIASVGNAGAILAFSLYFSCNSSKTSLYSSIPSFTCSDHPSSLKSKKSTLLLSNSAPVTKAIKHFL